MSSTKKEVVLTPKQAKRREELRLKMVHHMSEESRYRQQIEKIDSSEKNKKKKWMLGKCFAMKGIGERAGDSGYCRVDGFRADGSPTGIKLHLYNRKVSSIEFNTGSLWESDILNGKKISHSRFDKYLEQARILTHTPEEDTIREKVKARKPLHTNFADKVKKIKPTVAYILKRDFDARDDDNLLCTLLWEIQGAKPNMKFKAFKKKLIMSELATAESITRSRRLLQEKYPDLRGKFYEERHQQEELLKNQLKMDFFD